MTNMGKVTVEALVDGGKATAGPPIGNQLGPLKVNTVQIVKEINEKTKELSGMKVPVKIIVDGSREIFASGFNSNVNTGTTFRLQIRIRCRYCLVSDLNCCGIAQAWRSECLTSGECKV